MILSIVLVSCLSLVYTQEVKVDVVTKAETCERAAKNGDTISMRYKGNLYDVATGQLGKQFDSNFDRPDTFDFKLGAGQVIQGWERGVPGMCVGERRKLTVPPQLAYGDVGFSDLIPPGSTLVFEIELVDLKAGEGHDHGGVHHDHEEDTFAGMDENGDKQITREEMAAYIQKFSDAGDNIGGNIEAIVDEIFNEDDKNKDGIISLDEYQLDAGHDHDHDHEEDEPQKEEL